MKQMAAVYPEASACWALEPAEGLGDGWDGMLRKGSFCEENLKKADSDPQGISELKEATLCVAWNKIIRRALVMFS